MSLSIDNFVPYKSSVTVELLPGVRNFSGSDLDELIAKQQTEIGQEVPNLSPSFASEPIFNLVDYNPSTGVYLVNVTTGTMAKALQNVHKGKDPSQKPIVVQGIVRSDDGFLVMGIRGYPKSRTTLEGTDLNIMFTPAGYAKFDSTNPSLDANLYTEAHEEIGLEQTDIKSLRMYGHHKDHGWTEGIRLTYLVDTGLTFEEVTRKWTGVEPDFKGSDHAWEYTHLLPVKNSPEDVSKILAGDFSDFEADSVIGRTDSHAHTVDKGYRVRGLLEQSVVPPLAHYLEQLRN